MISNIRTIGSDTIESASWRTLKSFQNSSLVTDILSQKHKLQRSQIQNARKQAEQIRYCLQQAEEYFIASKSISEHTSPLLLYYGIMSLALAEILFKQTGDSSLDSARNEHRHHGLTMKFPNKLKNSFVTDALALRAVPHIVSGERKGTFELWHRTARHFHIPGKRVHHQKDGYSTTTETYFLLHEDDKNIKSVPESGINLLNCMSMIPRVHKNIPIPLDQINLIRGKVNEDIFLDSGNRITSVTIHPNFPHLIEKIKNSFRCSVSRTSDIDYIDIENSIIINIKNNINWNFQNTNFSDLYIYIPSAFCENSEEVFFIPEHSPLNEFGYYYFSMYILGNFCRYYPDLWMKQADFSTNLFINSCYLIDIARLRAPILLASELTETLHLTN